MQIKKMRAYDDGTLCSPPMAAASNNRKCGENTNHAIEFAFFFSSFFFLLRRPINYAYYWKRRILHDLEFEYFKLKQTKETVEENMLVQRV